MEGIISIGIAIIGVILFTTLLISNFINANIYLLLLSLLALICLVIPVIKRLRELDIKNLKMTLDKLESVKENVFAKQKDIQDFSKSMLKLLAVTTTLESIWGDEETNKYKKIIIQKRIKNILQLLNVSEDEGKAIFKYESALSDMQNKEGEERDRKWQEFKDVLKKESEEIN